MSEYASGMSMETVLSESKETKTYDKYQPVGEEQIKAWLNQGYLPEDILKADEIAMAKDMLISDVLSLKAEGVSWDQVGQKLNYQETVLPEETQKIIVEKQDGKSSYSSESYEQITEQVNSKGDTERKSEEDKIADRIDLPDSEVNNYLAMGFNIYEIQNAVRLFEQSGASVDTILNERKDGTDWKRLIEKYSNSERADAI
jgi:hypothetical protein